MGCSGTYLEEHLTHGEIHFKHEMKGDGDNAGMEASQEFQHLYKTKEIPRHWGTRKMQMNRRDTAAKGWMWEGTAWKQCKLKHSTHSGKADGSN